MTSLEERPRVGISACLLGEAVRWDGTDRRHVFLAHRASEVLTWRPVCPEVDLGLGVPRDPIHLRQTPDGVRLHAVEGDADHTDAMDRQVAQAVDRARAEGWVGWVFKARSPSCGLGDAAVEDAWGNRLRGDASGRFADGIQRALPAMVLVCDDDLTRPAAREHFLTRVLAGHALAAAEGLDGLRAWWRTWRGRTQASSPDAIPALDAALRRQGEPATVEPLRGSLREALVPCPTRAGWSAALADAARSSGGASVSAVVGYGAGTTPLAEACDALAQADPTRQDDLLAPDALRASLRVHL